MEASAISRYPLDFVADAFLGMRLTRAVMGALGRPLGADFTLAALRLGGASARRATTAKQRIERLWHTNQRTPVA
jgi:hypothetical protein